MDISAIVFLRKMAIVCVLMALASTPINAAEYDIKPATNALESTSRLSKAVVKVINTIKTDTIDIASKDWHGGAVKLFLKNGRWPAKMIIKLHAGDGTRFPRLESFSLSTNQLKINARSGARQNFSLYKDVSGSWVKKNTVRMPINLEPAYISIVVPVELFRDQPRYLKIAWIYMYSLQ